MNTVIPFINTSIFFILKLAVLFALLIYIIFSLIVLRQVNLMIETLEVRLNNTIRVIAFIHVIISFILFGFALVIL